MMLLLLTHGNRLENSNLRLIINFVNVDPISQLLLTTTMHMHTNRTITTRGWELVTPCYESRTTYPGRTIYLNVLGLGNVGKDKKGFPIAIDARSVARLARCKASRRSWDFSQPHIQTSTSLTSWNTGRLDRSHVDYRLFARNNPNLPHPQDSLAGRSPSPQLQDLYTRNCQEARPKVEAPKVKAKETYQCSLPHLCSSESNAVLHLNVRPQSAL